MKQHNTKVTNNRALRSERGHRSPGSDLKLVALRRAETGREYLPTVGRTVLERGEPSQGTPVGQARTRGGAAMTRAKETERCLGCSRPAPASVCDECVRAIALKWWGAIARHATDASHKCALCEIGHPAYCGNCAVDAIQAQRARLREAGHAIQGEPPSACPRIGS